MPGTAAARERAANSAVAFWTYLRSCPEAIARVVPPAGAVNVDREWLRVHYTRASGTTGSFSQALYCMCLRPDIPVRRGGRGTFTFYVTPSTSNRPQRPPPAGASRAGQSAFRAFGHSLEALARDKGGVRVDELRFNAPRPGMTARQRIVIHNAGRVARELRAVRPLLPVAGLSLSDEHGVCRGSAVVLNAGASYAVHLELKAERAGVARGLLVFDLGSFHIVRALEVSVESELAASLVPTAPYTPPPRPRGIELAKEQLEPLIPGERPFSAVQADGYTAPKPHAIPLPLLAVRGSAKAEARVSAEMGALAAQETLSAHARQLQTLLWLEEAQMAVDIRAFDQPAAQLKPAGRLLRLTVPGLAEGRPSVLRGDSIHARRAGDRCRWEGCVHQVERDALLLAFDRRFHATFVSGQKAAVAFSFRRMPLRLMHHALCCVRQASAIAESESAAPRPAPRAGADAELCAEGMALRPLLFPTEADLDLDAPAARALRSMAPLHSTARLNAAQRRAVEEIASRAAPAVPYCVFGPPGTGKTTTLSAAIIELIRRQPASRVLACAPSNAAADEVCSRLIRLGGLDPSELVRVYAFAHERKAVPEALERYALYSEREGGFTMPPVAELRRRSVVVATACTAAKLACCFGAQPGLFSHVAVDEAGHALEAELLAAFVPLVAPADGRGARTQLVLAGDPRQLGPIVRSSLAAAHGLDVSMLERLMARALYARRALMEGAPSADGGDAPPAKVAGGYDDDAAPETDGEADEPYEPRCLMKLVRNYRSHPALLSLPSRLFYDGELRACADPQSTHALLRWEGLPNPSVPLLFEGVVGRDEREGSSPSWFNAIEVERVLAHIESLRAFRTSRVAPAEIGVISPYRKQVLKLRAALGSRGLGEVKVGSVEEFQGQERRVIIVSTVRSSAELIEFDARHSLGFVANPKRFNVAVTRARALLVVVGNPHVLRQDAHWGALLEYAVRAGAYTGCEHEPVSAEVLRGALGGLGRGDDADGGAPAAADAPSGDDAASSTGAHSSAPSFVDVENANDPGHAYGLDGPEWRRDE